MTERQSVIPNRVAGIFCTVVGEPYRHSYRRPWGVVIWVPRALVPGLRRDLTNRSRFEDMSSAGTLDSNSVAEAM